MPDIPGNPTTDANFEGFAGTGSYSGMLETWGDQDWIEVQLFEGTTYNFRYTGFTPTGGHEIGIRLINPAGQGLSGVIGPGGGIGITPPAGQGGRYFISILSSNGDPAEYSVSVSTDPSTAYGDAGDNVITGGATTIFGGLGNDRLTLTAAGKLFGDAGNDVLVGSNVDFGTNIADRLFGGPGNDSISGGIGADQLVGSDGNDVLAGGTGNDRLAGGTGNDTLNGGTGADGMAGEAGNDAYVVDNAGDIVSEFAASGNDLVLSSISFNLANTARVFGAVENLALLNVATALNGNGNNLANVITGNNFNNTLNGQAGNDTLRGGAGHDILIGGPGRDVMAGGLHNDIFRFAATHSAGATPDLITDFDDFGNDRIDLSALPGVLTYRHSGAFTGARQVRINDIAGPDIIVQVNTGGSLAADFAIRLSNTTLGSMTGSDFIL